MLVKLVAVVNEHGEHAVITLIDAVPTESSLQQDPSACVHVLPR